jgi:hypothetical protein
MSRRLRTIVKITIKLCLALTLTLLPAYGYAEMAGTSTGDQLSEYLHQHKLPLVQAQISQAAGGPRQVVLYGYVATELGKQHAQEHARQYLNDSSALIVNRIKVRPEIATLHNPSQGAGNAPATETAPASHRSDSNLESSQSYSGQAPADPKAKPLDLQDQQAYTRQADGGMMGFSSGSSGLGPDLLTMLVLGAVLGLGGGHSSFGGGYGSSSFGRSYGPYPSPYSSQPGYGSYSSPYSYRPGIDPYSNNQAPYFSGPNSSPGYNPYDPNNPYP